MKLWYQNPAEKWVGGFPQRKWNEALPVGNGRLGGMVFGGPLKETIQLNEDSIWSGKKMDRINPDAKEYLPVIRKLIREGNPEEAQRLALYALSGTPNSQRAYQNAGELVFGINGLNQKQVQDYRRELDLTEGVARSEFCVNNITYRKEVFTSWPDDCMCVRIWNDQNVPFDFDCLLGRNRNFTDEVKAEGGNTIYFVVNAPEGGISFCVTVKVAVQGGKIRTIGEHIVAEQVTEVKLVLDIETSFRHTDYIEAAKKRCETVLQQEYAQVLEAHKNDYKELFSRLQLHFGHTDASKDLIPTDVRLKAVQNGEEDMGLLEQYFQFGRYLLIASSRKGALPANLQGIWNDSLTPPWDSKYTININAQMNYWAAESSNLSECHLPLFEHLERIKENGKETARRMYGCRGSVAHHNTDVYADTAPQDHYIPATFWVFGEAWLATHIWEHYLYTNDKEFLKTYFDILEQCVLFFYDFLIENEEGCLVTSPSLSPENTYRMEDGTEGVLCESSTMDVELLIELFNGYIGACEVLGEDTAKIEEAVAVMKRFPKLKIGKHGQLQEWMVDYDEPEPGHRHISHLYGVYPGNSIAETTTPELMKAAKVSLERRLANGGGHTGWSRAWIIGLWAAFMDGERAYENLRAILSMGTFPNLMDTHPYEGGYVFQIDGNFGACAAMLEMLVKCRDQRIHLLPAIAKETADGEVSGIRIRGGAELSMKWENGLVKWLRIMPDKLAEPSMPFELVVNGTTETIQLERGKEFVKEF